MEYIFIHGLGQNSTSWSKTILHLSEPIQARSLDLYTLLNGKELTYANLYQKFSDYCKDVAGPLSLCGLSLGGVLALNYAIDYPTKVKSLVLIAAQYRMPRKLLKLQNTVFNFMPESAFKSSGFHKKDFIQLTNSMMNLDFSQRLKDISSPALIICGKKDWANIKAGKSIAERIPVAKLMLLDGAGHEVNIENPKELAFRLSEFILEHS